MERKKIINWGVLILVVFLIFLVFKSTIIMPSKSGQILDTTTNLPVKDVSLVRVTFITEPHFDGTGERKIRTEVIKSDIDGRFEFGSYVKFKSPLNNFYRELLYVNDQSKPFYSESDVDLNLTYNQTYESKILGVGFSGLKAALFGASSYSQNGYEYQPFNSKNVVKLNQK